MEEWLERVFELARYKKPKKDDYYRPPDYITFMARIPIVGWESSLFVSVELTEIGRQRLERWISAALHTEAVEKKHVEEEGRDEDSDEEESQTRWLLFKVSAGSIRGDFRSTFFPDKKEAELEITVHRSFLDGGCIRMLLPPRRCIFSSLRIINDQMGDMTSLYEPLKELVKENIPGLRSLQIQYYRTHPGINELYPFLLQNTALREISFGNHQRKAVIDKVVVRNVCLEQKLKNPVLGIAFVLLHILPPPYVVLDIVVSVLAFEMVEVEHDFTENVHIGYQKHFLRVYNARATQILHGIQEAKKEGKRKKKGQ